MTGRYLIYTPLESQPKGWRQDDRRFDAHWHTFVAICRSLHRDGLSYSVQFNLTGDNPHVLITASGKAVQHPKPATRATVPQPLRLEQIQQQIRAVEYYLPENAETRRRTFGIAPRVAGRRRYDLGAMAEEHLRAELEYWRELELLSSQREHFKPGLTEETLYADDEVAA